MPVLARTRIDKNNRTTVPHEVRKLLEIGNSDTIERVYEDDCVHIRKASRCKLLILSPSYKRNTSPEPLPAIERYEGLFYRIVRRYMDKVREKDIDIIIITEDLEVATPETKLPYKPPVGEKWKTMPPTTRDPEKIEKLRNQILEMVKDKRYDEIFIALNKHYQALLPDLTPYTKKIIANPKGLGSKAKSLKNGCLGENNGHQ